MMSASVIAQPKFYGLIELDREGMVIYSRAERNGDDERGFTTNLAGLNFYTEVAPFNNVKEFQQCVEAFGRSALHAKTINFTCDYEDGPVRVRVLMARIRERSESAMTKSILVHIRKIN